MDRRRRWGGSPLVLLSAAVLHLINATPAAACSHHVSVWEWERCWLSVPRWLLLGAAAAAWWFVCFHRLFPRLLSPDRSDAPMPSAAFRRCLGLFSLLVCVTFVLLFAALSDELSARPARGAFLAGVPVLDRNWKWMLVLLIGGLLSLAVSVPGKRGQGTGDRGQ